LGRIERSALRDALKEWRMDTESLIDRLTEHLGPVRRLKPSWVRATKWLALGIAPLLISALVDGVVVNATTLFGDRRMIIELAATLGTAATAAICAFSSTIPGASRK
jgi:hypothetical protein